MNEGHVAGVVALQRACFPEPFPEELLWQKHHIEEHLALFPEGQWVVCDADSVVASCSNFRCPVEEWEAHLPLKEITGGLKLRRHDPEGGVLYGIDISVHPDHRRKGVARMLYGARLDFVRDNSLDRYGTVCRLPGFSESGSSDPSSYAAAVEAAVAQDRTLTPLLKMGLTLCGVIMDYMDDQESGDAGAVLEWRP